MSDFLDREPLPALTAADDDETRAVRSTRDDPRPLHERLVTLRAEVVEPCAAAVSSSVVADNSTPIEADPGKRWHRVEGHLIDRSAGLRCEVSRPSYDPFADDRPTFATGTDPAMPVVDAAEAPVALECCAACGRPLIGDVRDAMEPSA